MPWISTRDREPRRLTSGECLVLLLASSFCVSAATVDEETPVDCETVQDCLDLIPQYIDKSNGISREESALATQLQAFEADAIPDLLALLSSTDEHTRDFAAFTLRDIQGLAPQHVAPILQAALKEDQGGWLPPALARIDDPEAIAGLVTLLRKYPQTENQIGAAFERLGAKSIPALLPLLDEDAGGTDLSRAVGSIFARLGADAEDAALPLARIAADHARPNGVRLNAVAILSQMVPNAGPATPTLVNLLNTETGDMQAAVMDALFHIGGDGLGAVYAAILAPPEVSFDGIVTDRNEQLGFDDYSSRLMHVAALGTRGRDAVPAVLHLLYEPHPDIRVNAARTLGFIGDASIGRHLVTFVYDKDWLMVRTVAESLGRVRYISARDELNLIARNYWYPPVRTIAKEANAALDGVHSYRPLDETRSAYYNFKAFSFATPTPCATTEMYPEHSFGEERLRRDQSPAAAKQFTYRYEIDTYDEDGSRESVVAEQIPQVGLRAPNGWFLGSSRGEFGGEIVWRPDDGSDQIIARDNIEDIYELSPGRYVAIAGLAHLGFVTGHVYQLERSKGRWNARYWLRLPGAPLSSWKTKTGDLLINTSGGSVLLSANGTLRMANCVAVGQVTPNSLSN